MIPRALLTALLVIAGATPVTACECLWQGSFVEVAPTTDLVVSGRVIRQRGNALDLSVDDVALGSELQNQIRVWGDPETVGGRAIASAACRADLTEFPVGSQWVMALQRIETVPAGGFNPGTPNLSFGRVGDYALSRCGVYWLQRDGETVSGNLITAPRWQYQSSPNPVVLYSLLASYLHGDLERSVLERAASPRDRRRARELMDQTREFLQQQ